MTFSLQTQMPSVVTPTTQVLVTDIDGDGTNEVIMLDSTLGQLSVSHQFAWGQVNLNQISSSWSSTQPVWPGNNTFQWITVWGVPVGGIPVPQQATFSPWTIQFGDTIMAGDFDGDGIDELFIYNLQNFSWGVLKWISNGLQTIANQSVAPGTRSSSPNVVTWQASVNDEYFVIPNLSGIITSLAARSAGILLYNSQTFWMGMISYSAGKFSPWWNNPATSFPGWNLSAKGSDHPATNKFYPGNFANPGVPSIVVYNPSDAYIGLMQWNSSQSQWAVNGAQNHNVGNWSFGWTDQLQAADLDEDGMSEIFIYSGGSEGTTDIGVLKWVGGSFQNRAIAGGTFGNGAPKWTTGKNDTYLCLNGVLNHSPGQIWAFSPDTLKVGLLYYIQGWDHNWSIVVMFSQQTLAPNNGWPVTAADTFYAGPAWDTATPNLITLSNQGPTTASPVLTLGGLNWDVNEVIFVSSETTPVPAWSPAGLAADAPHTAFPQPPFPTANQQQIYAYISQLFPVPGVTNQKATNDVRSLYANTGYSSSWSGYSTALGAVTQLSQIPSSWPALPAGNTWQNSDWAAVVPVIVNECNQVIAAYSMYANLLSLAKYLRGFQGSDLGTVRYNIAQASQNSNGWDLEYWVGEIFVTAVWSFAANAGSFFSQAPTSAASFGVFLSTVASLAGFAFECNPTQQQLLSWSDVGSGINDTTAIPLTSPGLSLGNILNDLVKMNILSGLYANEWQVDSALPSTMQPPFQVVDRLWMYQQLIPIYLSIEIYEPGSSLPSSGATYTLNNVGYVLKSAAGNISASQFSGTTLYTDLFTTLHVTEEDFFVGNGGWSAIQRTTA